MRILVIGGTQFMGREVVERLARRGHELSVLHRRDHHDLGPEIGNIQRRHHPRVTPTTLLSVVIVAVLRRPDSAGSGSALAMIEHGDEHGDGQ